MALSLDCIPVQTSFRFNISELNLIGAEFISPLLSPKNSGGTVVDMTSATSVSINLDNNQSFVSPTYSTVNPTNTLGTHDATGISFTIAHTDVANLYNSLKGVQSGRMSVLATDGTNTVIVAQGTWSLNISA